MTGRPKRLMREHLAAYGFVGVMPLIVTLGTGGWDEVVDTGESWGVFLIFMLWIGYRAGKDSQKRRARKAGQLAVKLQE